MEQIIKQIIEAETLALNSEKGQEIMKNLLDESMKQNPDLTNEEWNTIKKNFMLLIFEKTIAENPELLKNI